MIFCVEDDSNIRELVIYTLETTGFKARGFEDGKEFLEALALETPELILLDIMLPGMDGLELLSKLKASPKNRDIPVIMLTAKGAEYDKVKALDAGADDYVTKPFNILEVKARIKSIFRRSQPQGELQEEKRIIRVHDLEVNCQSRTVVLGGQPVRLTAKEFDLLQLLITHRGKVYSREALLETVWKYDYMGDMRTVDVHIRRLREKIERDNAGPEFILTKWGVGYYFAD